MKVRKITETLSDGSKVFNIELYQDDGNGDRITLSALSEQHADRFIGEFMYLVDGCAVESCEQID